MVLDGKSRRGENIVVWRGRGIGRESTPEARISAKHMIERSNLYIEVASDQDVCEGFNC